MIGMLRATLELDEVLQLILDGVFGIFPQASCGLVLLRNDDDLTPKAIKYRGAETRPTQYSRSIVAKAMSDKQGILSHESVQMSDSDSNQTKGSAMCVPLLRSNGAAMGVIQIETDLTGFDVDDLQILNCAATQLAVAIENAELHQDLLRHERLRKELDFARAVQHGFLPRANPELPGYRFWAFYEPARQVGGDFLDFVHVPNGDLVVLLGDAAGKGVPASLVMAKVSALSKLALCREPIDLPAAMQVINRETCESRVGSMVTLVICRVSPTDNTLTMCSAGHMSPIIRRVDASLHEPLEHAYRGLPLGVDDAASYCSVTVPIAEGEYVLLFSDGVTDAMNLQDQRYLKGGISNVMTQALPTDPADLGQSLLDDIRRHENGREQMDDMSLIVFSRESSE
jgi:serine phosphatase RsbU (regulator of sigma subunit)